MEAAAFVGDMRERVHLALYAGCDMALVCNNRPAVLELLNSLADKVWKNHSDEKIQKRLNSLYAKPSFEVGNLEKFTEWKDSRLAIDGLNA